MFGAYEWVTRRVLNLVDPYVHGTGETPSSRVWPYLRSHLRPLRSVLVLSIFVTILAASMEVWLISYAGKLIDMLADTSPAEIWQTHGWSLIFAAVMIILIRPLSQFARHSVNEFGLSCNSANLFRWRAYDHLTRQSVGWFQEDLAGRTASRLVLMGNYAGDVIFHALNALAFGLVYMVGVVTFMAGIDIRLAIPLFVWLALYVTLMTLIVPRMVRSMETFMAAKSALLGGVVDVFSNFDTVSLFARRKDIEEDHKDSLEATREKLFLTRQISVGMRTITVWLEGVIIVGFVGYGIFLWSQGAASIGLVSAAMAMSLRITTMADWVSEAVWSIFQQVGSVREALRSISQPLAIPSADTLPDFEMKGGEIIINDAHHHYGKGKGGLDGINLTIRAGEKIGLVGPSGAGKSTLVNLILRFYEPEDGQIKIDGQDVRSVNLESLRNAIGMVSQQAALLNRSVRDNIALGQPDIMQSQIESAARRAHAHDFICDLTDSNGRTGYDAHVGERGVKLSGGQRQRIALARVFMKDAPILILDEATSALDSEVEAEIQSSLQTVMQGKTVIAIAHRLSTIAEMDRIIVIKDGTIVENGTHQDLLNADQLYASLWNRQSGGFIGAED
ncbi:ABC transporter ATP-binding protein [Octadecabacter sp. 1_MG-2023]|uniref:ABC transporter ATP-binding protein n=1 Tax=unclassified Octadecabacter TaxID=196158 RepID=UPI001C0A61AC|nr:MULTISPECIES: ABC transporter ATP-binding protein [unclassified Octadecabacter]MBU2992093.1 ABC transporter ATP-binding protein/permease [Octadecabacter sp. B2R22]MDO6735150.1 ABC transporter ATP-binding protein [Octadecabacter sp. 1_MG-2023]